MNSLIVKLVIWLLKRDLSLKDRATLLNAIMNKLAMLPLRDIITASDDGSLIIRGKKLDTEEERLVRESARSLRMNRAFGLIQDEILYVAMTYAVNSTVNFEQVYSAKMAVWWGIQENDLVKKLADGNPDLAGS